MLPPVCCTVPGAVLAIDTSDVAAVPRWVVEAVALLFPALSSGVPVTDAVLVNVRELVVSLAGTDTTIDTVAVPLPVALPILQVTVPEACVHVPCEVVAETNVTPAGSVSVTVTPVAAVFPAGEAVTE